MDLSHRTHHRDRFVAPGFQATSLATGALRGDFLGVPRMPVTERLSEGDLEGITFTTDEGDLLEVRQRGNNDVVLSAYDEFAGVCANIILRQEEVSELFSWLGKRKFDKKPEEK
jgi:hypothetical protein